MNPVEKRKIAECAFYGINKRIFVHTKGELNPVGSDYKGGRNSHNTDAVVVEKKEGATYAQMVSQFKKEIVELKKGSKEARNIYNRVKTKMQDGNVKLYGHKDRRIAMNFYGIDIDVTGKQVEEEICKQLKVSGNEVEVKALRPMRGGRQAATAFSSERTAQALLERDR
ncbi:hypothetical protein WA026_018382 [Henosepilachna vigintioctopunctata]|uniref:Uncharacterized protein n=1 Tax=Henosepilachna vigintioctopunctata TaxID=420089 RepID=A0AAW1V0U7_9CUCU